MHRIEEEPSRLIILDTIVSKKTAIDLIKAAEETHLARVEILAKPGEEYTSYNVALKVPSGQMLIQITAPNGVASQKLWNEINI